MTERMRLGNGDLPCRVKKMDDEVNLRMKVLYLLLVRLSPMMGDVELELGPEVEVEVEDNDYEVRVQMVEATWRLM